MPAKKKTASEKTPRTKTAAKKSTRKAAESDATKKTKSSAARKGTSTKTAKAAGSPASSGASENATSAQGEEVSKPKPTATELLKRTRHHTPSIFKVASRKHAPIVFTLEDVREILKKRKTEEAEEEQEAKAAAARETPKTGATPAPAEVPAQKSKHAAASLADILGFGAGPATPKSPAPGQQQDVPKQFKHYYALLMELRNHVRESLGMHAEDTLKRSQKEDSGDISTSADAGTDNFDRDFALSVVSSEQEALREIEAAIQRIHNGTYGICEITGEKIAPERLEAVPFTRFSLEGQRQYESTARRRVQRGGSFLSEGAADISFGDDDGDN